MRIAASRKPQPPSWAALTIAWIPTVALPAFLQASGVLYDQSWAVSFASWSASPTGIVVIGTIGVEHQHDKRRELPDTDGFYIDFSVSAAGNAAIGVGDPGAFVGETFWRGERVVGKSLDDRLGCAVLIEAMRRVRAAGTPHTTFFVFTVQEEVGARGAGPAAYGLEPDVAFVVDGTACGDQPHGRPMAVRLGGGVAIKTRDTGMIVPANLRDLLVQRAEEKGIPYQLEVLVGGGTDGRMIQVARGGVPTGGLSIPMRYIHTPSETADMDDVRAAVDLLAAVLVGEIAL